MKKHYGSVTVEYVLVWPAMLMVIISFFIIFWNIYVAMMFPFYVTESARITSNVLRDPSSPSHTSDPSTLFKSTLMSVIERDGLIPPLVNNSGNNGWGAIISVDVNYYGSVNNMAGGVQLNQFDELVNIVAYEANIKVKEPFISGVVTDVSFMIPVFR